MSGLRVENLQVRYGRITAVQGVSLHCDPGEILAIVGANGAGKSSTMLAIAGGLEDASVQGSVTFEGTELLGRPPEAIVKSGIALVPERRRIFGSLSVEENLRLGATVCDDSTLDAKLEEALERFPILGEKRHQRARLLSGGQQQQLAIARALMAEPRILLLDEPSLGLSPMLVETIFEHVVRMREEGIGIVLVEQNAVRAIEIADRSLVMRSGSITGKADGLSRTELTAAFLGADHRAVAS